MVSNTSSLSVFIILELVIISTSLIGRTSYSINLQGLRAGFFNLRLLKFASQATTPSMLNGCLTTMSISSSGSVISNVLGMNTPSAFAIFCRSWYPTSSMVDRFLAPSKYTRKSECGVTTMIRGAQLECERISAPPGKCLCPIIVDRRFVLHVRSSRITLIIKMLTVLNYAVHRFWILLVIGYICFQESLPEKICKRTERLFGAAVWRPIFHRPFALGGIRSTEMYPGPV